MTAKTHKFAGIILLTLFMTATFVTLTSCGSDDKKEANEAPVTTALKYSDVRATINSSCAVSGCHNTVSAASGSYSMSTRAAIATKASQAAQQIESGAMPQAPYKSALDANPNAKAALVKWLKAGAPE